MAIKLKGEQPPLVTVGQRIQAAREEHGITIAELSARTKVAERFIAHIEAGDFDRIPGRPYVFGFTGLICSTLDLDAEELLQVIKAEIYPEFGAPLAAGTAPADRQGLIARAMRAIENHEFHKVLFLKRRPRRRK